MSKVDVQLPPRVQVLIHYVTMHCCKTLAVEETLVNEEYVGRSHAYYILSLVVGCPDRLFSCCMLSFG